VGVIEGDRIIVTKGPLQGFESLIKKIDRHKRKATIEITLMGLPLAVDVGLEVISKTK
jgi:transcriptional antiterminator NusG